MEWRRDVGACSEKNGGSGLELSVLGLLDHVGVGEQEDLDAAVLSTPLGSLVAGYGLVVGHTGLGDAGGGDAVGAQEGTYGLGALHGDALVDLVRAGVVGVALDEDVGIDEVALGDLLGEVGERRLGSSAERGGVGGEEDALVESDLDGGEAVAVGDGLYLGVLLEFLLELLGLLVHVLADECTGAGAYCGADGGADDGTLALVLEEEACEGAYCSAAGGADARTLDGVVGLARREHSDGAYRGECQNCFLHLVV